MRLILALVCGVVIGALALVLLSGSNQLGIQSIPLETVKQKYANEHSRFLDYKGMKIHYRDEGSGPVLMLIHGVCASLHTWDGWVAELKKDFRIIRVDLPGFGLTPLTDIKFIERESSVAMVQALAASLGLDRFSMAGNSLGGYVAWTYACAHPEKVDRLILVDPAGYPMDFPWLLGFAAHPLIRPFARFAMPRFVFNMAVGQVYGDKSRITDAVLNRYFELAMREGGKRDYLEIFSALKSQLRKSSLSDGIDRITPPLLLMWGDKDTWISYPEQYLQWKNDHPGASFIVYRGAGHVPMEEIPAVTAADARSFLNGAVGPGEIIR
jgi:pimeloyl-ACP methyl ester carboxylesterase